MCDEQYSEHSQRLQQTPVYNVDLIWCKIKTTRDVTNDVKTDKLTKVQGHNKLCCVVKQYGMNVQQSVTSVINLSQLTTVINSQDMGGHYTTTVLINCVPVNS